MASAVETDSGDGGALGEPMASGAGRRAAQVARRIEETVIGRGWPVGELLGSESDLRAHYRVGRPVLREAIRLVEHHQVARMRRGPNGGLFVCAPDAEPAIRAMVIYLEYVGTSVGDLLEVRALLEPIAARLAADRITEEEIATLRAAMHEEHAQLLGPECFAVDPVHTLIGRLSGNPVLHLFIDVLARLTTRYARASRKHSAVELDATKREAHAAHRAIAEAVIDGDGARAQVALTTHLERLSTSVDPSRAHRRVGDRDAGFDKTAAPAAKLAEVLAHRIHADIAGRGWPVGTVLGSETDLVARYGISRPALREAVRLLEYHSVARMRPGPGGGLVVTEPEPQASVDTIALLLEYERVTADDFRIARTAIELATIGRVADRFTGKGRELPEQLAAAAQGLCEGVGTPSPPTGSFHTELVNAAGNPVLALYFSVVMELGRRHPAGVSAPAANVAADSEQAHHRILDALRSGDPAVARHRMRRHLAMLTH
ncbi:FadR/GntR family transcriptional regulator [Nocardia sp. alder85J]|uniref:FadR/GntR family transcriptional regulator n=1 Tax=Nocardia sp. alder85J TaxID=2862949 RepID=UPI001CD4D7F1|nr:FCD domain-containing protein [Nocardia sp. alder85J]MCX4094422.1 FCD domain-containing protein [Nocardia sp. alder85J]